MKEKEKEKKKERVKQNMISSSRKRFLEDHQSNLIKSLLIKHFSSLFHNFSSLFHNFEPLWPQEKKPFYKKAFFLLVNLYTRSLLVSIFLAVNFLHYALYNKIGQAFYFIVLITCITVHRDAEQMLLTPWQLFCMVYLFFILGFALYMYVFLRVPMVKNFCSRHLGEGYLDSKVGNMVRQAVGFTTVGGATYFIVSQGAHEFSVRRTFRMMDNVEINRTKQLDRMESTFQRQIVYAEMQEDPALRIRLRQDAESRRDTEEARINRMAQQRTKELQDSMIENNPSDMTRLEATARRITVGETVSSTLGSGSKVDPVEAIRRMLGGGGSGSGTAAVGESLNGNINSFSYVLVFYEFLNGIIKGFVELNQERWE